ncbi:hypothetical protein Droror1_Dr00005892 [Drosera rotundifolia]
MLPLLMCVRKTNRLITVDRRFPTAWCRIFQQTKSSFWVAMLVERINAEREMTKSATAEAEREKSKRATAEAERKMLEKKIEKLKTQVIVAEETARREAEFSIALMKSDYLLGVIEALFFFKVSQSWFLM